MKVAIHTSLDPATGISRYTQNLLIELGRNALDVRAKVFTYPIRPARPEWLPAAVTYQRSRLPGRAQRVLVERIGIPASWLFNLRDCDLFHLTHTDRLRPHRPWVLTVYDVAWRTMGTDYLSIVTTSWIRDTEAAIAEADHLLAISQATADELVRGGIPANRITITPLGVDERFLKVGPDQARAVRDKYRLPKQYVLYVGALNIRKNVTTLARAMAEPVPIDGIGLVLVGPPPKEGLATWGLDHTWVTHLGYIPDDDLPGLYAAASVVAIPARLEGFGLPLVEAMASGTLVVASDLPVFREVGGEVPLYFPSDDSVALRSALSIIFRDPAAVEQMRSAGRRRASQFTWAACAEATAEAYRLTLSRSKR